MRWCQFYFETTAGISVMGEFNYTHLKDWQSIAEGSARLVESWIVREEK